MTISQRIQRTIAEAEKAVGKSELQRRARQRIRRDTGGTIVAVNLGELLSVALNRKDLIGSEMGEMRTVKLNAVVPNPKAKSIIFKAEAYGTKMYQMLLTFYKVDFAEKKDNTHPLSVDLGEGERLYAEHLKIRSHPCMIRCECMDFKMTFAYYDKQHSALAGRAFPAYVRKTPPPPNGYPERNAAHVPGICKHLFRLCEVLKGKQVLV